MNRHRERLARWALYLGWPALAAQLGFIVHHSVTDAVIVLGPTAALGIIDVAQEAERQRRARVEHALAVRRRDERAILDRWAHERGEPQW